MSTSFGLGKNFASRFAPIYVILACFQNVCRGTLRAYEATENFISSFDQYWPVTVVHGDRLGRLSIGPKRAI